VRENKLNALYASPKKTKDSRVRMTVRVRNIVIGIIRVALATWPGRQRLAARKRAAEASGSSHSSQ